MSLVVHSSYIAPLRFSPWKIYNSNSQQKFSCNSFTPLQHRTVSSCKIRHISAHFRNEPNDLHKYVARCKGHDYESYTEQSTMSLDWDVEEEFEDTESPWEGAVIYKRNASVSHLEYCTTLERLALGKLSTDVSKTRASVMGLRVTKAVKDYPNGTPVQISIDVTRKKKKLRLDGIIKTVITLLCNRCCMPSAECIFSEFSLLLTEEPIDEPETIDLGVIFGEDKFTTSGNSGENDNEDALIDLDDQLYFPPEEKQIDISKNIRDRVHLEITMNSVCDPECKGMCLKCGQNFNTGNCNCSKEEVKEKSFSPFGNLKEQIQL
ncbi:large ribosomal RNA subunit accumulation protein YCED homolog 1, chloroplastic [Gastrolobium bilobum]|uniref:large ribosomal RNA subunit accumulation protein YCED homolog 1, chloroplastic n=1 Tax=Gastrolobium bilobum TaxID=150636 RepID=UPI002AB2B3A6|nr:large ribosomal RNA subunit accumulation protein YCED homolog 1, chloroplastic [Gastrolobium bilobum]